MAARHERLTTTYFGSPPAGTVASGGSPSSPVKKSGDLTKKPMFQSPSFGRLLDGESPLGVPQRRPLRSREDAHTPGYHNEAREVARGPVF